MTKLCSILGKLGRKPKKILVIKECPGHDRRYAIDASKMKEELGWRLAETFESGILKNIQWYLANKEWCQCVTDGSYCGKRLGIM